jgi:hypothetical protein
MPTDHIGISKFETFTDEAFQVLIAKLQGLTDGAWERSGQRWQRFQGRSRLRYESLG